MKDIPPLTDADIKRLEEASRRPPVYDPENPPMTEEESKELAYMMKKYNTRRITKEMYIAEGLYTPKSKSE